MRRTQWVLLTLLLGCDSQFVYRDSVPLVPHGEAMDGRIWLLDPGGDAVIAVDPVARTAETIAVGRSPAALIRSPAADRLYTLDAGSRTLTRITPEGVSAIELSAPFNRLDWAPDGRHAVAWIDPNAQIDVTAEGSVNLNAFAIVEDDGTEVHAEGGSFNFAPAEVIWERTSRRALVRTDSRLVIFDVEQSPVGEWEVPFSANDAVRRPPALVATSPDGNRALVTVSGTSDLFVLRLDDVMIENVVGLTRAAMGLAFSGDGTRAVVADGTSLLSFVDLDSFEAATTTLSHPAARMATSQRSAEPFAMAWDDRGTTLSWSRVPLNDPDLAPDEVDTFVMADTVREIVLEPDETAAVVVHDLDLYETGSSSISLFSFAERAPSRILLDAPVTDMELLAAGAVGGSTDPHAVILLRDSSRVIRYNLRTYEQVVLDTYGAGQDIGFVPGPDLLFVVHDRSPGLVSFVEPDSAHEPPGGFPAVGGLGLDGILDRR